MSPTTAARPTTLLLALLALAFWLPSAAPVVSALPQLLIESGKAKCVQVSVPSSTHIRVEYEAPDLAGSKGPVWVTVNPSAEGLNNILPGRKRKDFKPVSEEIKSPTGSISQLIEDAGEFSVCIRASPASAKNPMRFGLVVKTGRSKSEQTERKDKEHLSGIEMSLARLTDEMEEILDEADFAKEREMIFHNQSRSMAQASVYWPILHLAVLCITGVTMANHIVRFFKSRHII